jgi:7,8-dihydroneopterin aldolase/epimerase/oxygenase
VSDCVILKDLQVFARHGVHPEEARLGQRFAVDVTAHLDLRHAGESDDYALTLCYDALAKLVVETLTTRRFLLIEAAAEATAQVILKTFAIVERVEVEVRKPAAPINAVFAYVGVRVERRRGG